MQRTVRTADRKVTESADFEETYKEHPPHDQSNPHRLTTINNPRATSFFTMSHFDILYHTVEFMDLATLAKTCAVCKDISSVAQREIEKARKKPKLCKGRCLHTKVMCIQVKPRFWETPKKRNLLLQELAQHDDVVLIVSDDVAGYPTDHRDFDCSVAYQLANELSVRVKDIVCTSAYFNRTKSIAFQMCCSSLDALSKDRSVIGFGKDIQHLARRRRMMYRFAVRRNALRPLSHKSSINFLGVILDLATMSWSEMVCLVDVTKQENKERVQQLMAQRVL